MCFGTNLSIVKLQWPSWVYWVCNGGLQNSYLCWSKIYHVYHVLLTTNSYRCFCMFDCAVLGCNGYSDSIHIIMDGHKVRLHMGGIISNAHHCNILCDMVFETRKNEFGISDFTTNEKLDVRRGPILMSMASSNMISIRSDRTWFCGLRVQAVFRVLFNTLPNCGKLGQIRQQIRFLHKCLGHIGCLLVTSDIYVPKQLAGIPFWI